MVLFYNFRSKREHCGYSGSDHTEGSVISQHMDQCIHDGNRSSGMDITETI